MKDEDFDKIDAGYDMISSMVSNSKTADNFDKELVSPIKSKAKEKS